MVVWGSELLTPIGVHKLGFLALETTNDAESNTFADFSCSFDLECVRTLLVFFIRVVLLAVRANKPFLYYLKKIPLK